MKNKTTILIIVILLLSVTPVKATATRYSGYVSFGNDATGLELTNNIWEAFSPSSFSTPANGDVYRLDATGFPATYFYTTSGFTALYSGAVKMSGKCAQSKTNLVNIRMQFRDGRWQDVAFTSERVFSFFTFFNAGDFQLLAQSPSYTVLKCSLLFEVLQ